VTRRRSRGFTLIEVTVGAAVALIVIGIVTATFLSQQRSLQALDLSREASNAARDAMLSLQETIGRAGYGVDPRYAFDFKSYNCPDPANPCRDRFDFPDQIVFVSRDPDYNWAGTPESQVPGCSTSAPCTGHAWLVRSFDATHVTVAAAAGDTFLKGQVVQIACAQGRSPTMGQVATTIKAASATDLAITLENQDANNPYRFNVPGAHDACFDNANSGVSLFLVNRYRYHVATVNGEPWLMLDRGLDYNQNNTTAEVTGGGTPDTADEIPIARGVEDMQIAYLLRPDPTGVNAAPDKPNGGGDWIIGNAPATVEEPDPSKPAPISAWNPSVPPPGGPPDADDAAVRFNTNPANIRGVRIRLTVRSLRQDITQASTWFGDPATPPDGSTSIENRTDFVVVTLGHFRRYFTSVSVATLNLASKNPFIF
jgi:type IV pilus assembly protein PilW